MIDWQLRIPWGYETRYVTLAWARDELLRQGYHPEYVRRLIAWLHSKKGRIGIGGAGRAGGAQPDKPGFAPEGQTFHQDQNYDDGFCGKCAVDVVAVDGPDGNHWHDGVTWADVPRQGSAEAARWGVHSNVGTPGQPGSEAWHIQPVEIDGWLSWWNAGRPAPVPNYPIPVEDEMRLIDPPRRLIDTRPLGAPVAVGQVIEIDTKEIGSGVAVNITVDQTTGPGYVTAWGRTKPPTSNLNYDRAGQTIANVANVPLDGSKFRFTVAGAPAHVIIDLQGIHG